MPDYFHKTNFILSDYVERYCPICEKGMNKTEFIGNNIIYIFRPAKKDRKDNSNEISKIWEDSRIAIPCCNCYKYIQEIVKYKSRITNIGKTFVEYDDNMKSYYGAKLIQNLKKFGIIQ